MFRKINPKRLVYRRGVGEHLRQVWLQENDVRPLLVALVVLAPNATTKVVFGSHFIILIFHRFRAD
jgi:hypothetical protein